VFNLIGEGELDEAVRLLQTSPEIRVNHNHNGDFLHWTMLHKACYNNQPAVVAALLAHPDIDVNFKDTSGQTPFILAHYTHNPECVRLMLKDPRVLVNEPDRNGTTPLWMAAFNNSLDIVKLWIASGRGMYLGDPGSEMNALEMARREMKTELVSLLENFTENPVQTRWEVRQELRRSLPRSSPSWWCDRPAAVVFAMVVFLSDGLLETRKGEQETEPAARFFRIATRLPLELQMVLCCRLVGSSEELILGQESEEAFVDLARILSHHAPQLEE